MTRVKKMLSALTKRYWQGFRVSLPVSEACGVSLPELQEEDRPEAHEHGEGHRELVVEEDLVSGHVTSLLQSPEVAGVTDWTHDSVAHGAPAYVTRYLVITNLKKAVNEDNQARNAGENQHRCKKSQPCKIQTNFHSKIFSDCIQWLILVPFLEKTPLFVQLSPL